MELEEFINKKISDFGNRRSGSRLNEFKNDINRMREAGLTYAHVKEYLELKGLTVSINTISWYCRNHLCNNTPVEKNSSASIKSPNHSTQTASEKEITPEEKIDKKTALPSWHTGSAKSLDDLI